MAHTLTDPTAAWTTHQWRGYKLLTADNVKRNILDNTGTELFFDGPSPIAGSSAYAIAWDFAASGSFATRIPLMRYKVSNNAHSTWFEPTYDLELRGTLYDPFNRLYGGAGLPLDGTYGPNDVAAYILTKVTVVQGRAVSASGAVFNLDPTQPAPAPNSLVGMYLNPNQNQEQMFEILANTATQLTVAGSITSLIRPGQYYYVLRPRDRVRFQRLTKRLRSEFTDTDINIHVLFV